MNKKRTFIIAEAGVNHNGNIDLAKKLIDVAVEAKVDAIKFQTFKAENLVSSTAPKADYQLKDTQKGESQYQMLKKLELDIVSHKMLIDYCKNRKIIFMSTPFDLDSIDLLGRLDLSIYKISSGEITNLPYLRKIGSLKKKIILSTGMANLKEVEKAFKIIIDAGTSKKNITILHANTEYPTPYEDVNLLAMNTIAKKLDVEIGYSDHTEGIEIPIAAVAMGATVIEKHFTLDKNMEGPDHKASLEPKELIAMVNGIRNIEKAFGDGIKKPSNSEIKNIKIVRKSIHITANLLKNHTLCEDDLIMKRPGDGISPMKMDDIIGKRINKNLNDDYKLSNDDLI